MFFGKEEMGSLDCGGDRGRHLAGRQRFRQNCRRCVAEVVRSVFYAPQYVALSLGFFEDEGLEIDLSTAWERIKAPRL